MNAMQPIYLDYNSTTPIDPEVLTEMNRCHELGYLNPASQHRMGQHARQRIEQLRTRICSLLGCETTGMRTDTLIVTSGATESNNLALIGFATASTAQSSANSDGDSPDDPRAKQVLISSIEHPSVFGAADELKRRGFTVKTIDVDRRGVCSLDHLEELTEQPTLLVSMMLANNETGVLQPVKQAAEICRTKGIAIHTDAVQAIGKMDVNFRELGVDMMSFTAHKLHGPRGVGGLITRPDMVLHPLLHGGFQQMAVRPGTEDVSLMAGMCRAIELYFADPDGRTGHLGVLRDQLLDLLRKSIPDLVVNGEGVKRVPHTLNISIPGVNRQALLMAADFRGLAISTGSACASGSSEPSPVLVAMSVPDDVLEGSIRISLGIPTTAAEIEMAASRIIGICNDLRPKKD